ncbi:hypothetical protein GRX03_14140 [Halovenus sp. WSH3]|uniref:Uncharacterized protein n=1 Tax=Halovenus carboxidivorans TaxID=2692199 RepID=A0A6B0TCU6_9EURY|nr:hypothetical protein [Halovenus carboxidivorans]MXR52740.1 hypothetical protein [Halovenus carboxidivorans]
MYDLSAVLGFDWAVTLGPGTTLCLADTDGTDPTRWVDAVLADGLRNGEAAVLVSMDRPATAALDDLGADVAPRSVCVIDCQGTERTRRTLDDGTFVYSVPDADDLTGIGIGLTACLDRLAAAGHDRGRVGFHSFGVILDRVGQQAAFKFAHVVSSRLESAGFLGAFGLEQPHSPKSRRILGEAFDRTLELRQGAQGPEGRTLGRRGDSGPWRAVPAAESDR